MKKVLPLVLLFAVLIYILPLAALFFPSGKNEESGSGTAPAPSASAPPVTDGTQAPSAPQPGTSAADDAEPPLLILDENTGEVAEVSVRDFVRGAVAAEMPMTYPDEALRAQAVAAHSYALAVKAQADPDNEALKGAYFSANPTQRLPFCRRISHGSRPWRAEACRTIPLRRPPARYPGTPRRYPPPPPVWSR